MTDANAAGNFFFDNQCNHPVKVAIAFQDLNNQWRQDGWWTVNPVAGTYLAAQNNTRLVSNNNHWYFYAETIDGSGLIWNGNQNIPFNGQMLSMRETTTITAARDFYGAISCPQTTPPPQQQGPPTYQGQITNQNSADIEAGGANGYATFYRDGTLQITGDAFSNQNYKGTKANVFVILVDGWGRALYVSPSYSIPTACGQFDPTCSSSARGSWTFQVPREVAPYIASVDVYIAGRASDYWRSRVSAINSAVKAYDDLDPRVKYAIAVGLAAL
jgi:uncharacterized membrane protein